MSRTLCTVLLAALLAACDRAMARDPADRFATATEFADELEAWLDGARRREQALDVVALAEATGPEAEAMHAYQYNLDTAVPDFSKRFVTAHLGREVAGNDIAYLPIAGIKPILGLLPLACGCATDRVGVATMTAPGYPIPADWCAYHPHAEHQPLPLNVENQFLFAPNEIPAGADLIMTN